MDSLATLGSQSLPEPFLVVPTAQELTVVCMTDSTESLPMPESFCSYHRKTVH